MEFAGNRKDKKYLFLSYSGSTSILSRTELYFDRWNVATELLPKSVIAIKGIAGSFDVSIARISTRGITEKVINFRGGISFLKLTVAYVNKQFPQSAHQPMHSLNRLTPELFFLMLAHPVYKMWITQEPNKLALWNKLHFEEKKTDSLEHV